MSTTDADGVADEHQVLRPAFPEIAAQHLGAIDAQTSFRPAGLCKRVQIFEIIFLSLSCLSVAEKETCNSS